MLHPAAREVPLSGYRIALYMVIVVTVVLVARKWLGNQIRPTPLLIDRWGRKRDIKSQKARRKSLLERLRDRVFPKIPMV